MNSDSARLTLLHGARVASFAGTAHPDTVPAVSLNNKHSDAGTAAIENQQPAPVHPEFAFADGNVEVQTTDQAFWVHEYHLSKFAGSETSSNSGRRFIVACDETTKGEDICNTLKVVYASHIDGIADFDSSTLTSTLRIATLFDYPALRKFAISKLEGMNIPAAQRIQLSDEFTLPSWETPAFTELCSRKEPISQAEAEILGMSRFVEIARIRETERARLAVKFAGGIYQELLQASELSSSLEAENSDGSGSAGNTFGHSALPACGCYARNSYGTWVVQHCDIHKVAPKVLEEGKKLLKQRNELLERLESIRSVFNCRMERGDSPPNINAPDLATELSRASWIRRECTVAL
ncbi:unnamed protein product [Rhizoctonia solani]|uniref:BTB domain-containing protein n=1 Tax=Rhizoctonia solani TaxID=456999 RepID=A0A8H3GEY3_9AGAM|nr:unnamed protein product [Rhizoctonia solani]